MITVLGRGGISATVVKDSKNIFGDRVTTFQLRYHRFIHAEFMTHKMVSKNASSSRAIPVHKALESIAEEPAMPIHWGLNEPGMQAYQEGDASVGEFFWKKAATLATTLSRILWKDGKGFHKQIVNRLAEPFTFINVVATATDWENFFWLRHHAEAAPEIAELARCMYEARETSEPFLLEDGEWHLPYVDCTRLGLRLVYHDEKHNRYTLEEAQKVSASCCAQVSYRTLDQSLEKAIKIFERLVGGEPLHASPFEHPCMPYSRKEYNARRACRDALFLELEPIHGEELAKKMAGIVMYTGNFQGFTQYRKLLPGENITEKFTP